MFCRSLFVLLYFFFWPLYCVSFFYLRLLIIPLVSSNSYYKHCCLYQTVKTNFQLPITIEKKTYSPFRGMRYFLLNTNIPPLAQVRQCMVCYSSRAYYFMHLQVILLLFSLISGEQYFTTVIINFYIQE
jgi:hypothetical protein